MFKVNNIWPLENELDPAHFSFGIVDTRTYRVGFVVSLAQSLSYNYTFMSNPNWYNFHFFSCHGIIGTEILENRNEKLPL